MRKVIALVALLVFGCGPNAVQGPAQDVYDPNGWPPADAESAVTIQDKADAVVALNGYVDPVTTFTVAVESPWRIRVTTVPIPGLTVSRLWAWRFIGEGRDPHLRWMPTDQWQFGYGDGWDMLIEGMTPAHHERLVLELRDSSGMKRWSQWNYADLPAEASDGVAPVVGDPYFALGSSPNLRMVVPIDDALMVSSVQIIVDYLPPETSHREFLFARASFMVLEGWPAQDQHVFWWLYNTSLEGKSVRMEIVVRDPFEAITRRVFEPFVFPIRGKS